MILNRFATGFCQECHEDYIKLNVQIQFYVVFTVYLDINFQFLQPTNASFYFWSIQMMAESRPKHYVGWIEQK
jgi:hypothetical protein